MLPGRARDLRDQLKNRRHVAGGFGEERVMRSALFKLEQAYCQ